MVLYSVCADGTSCFSPAHVSPTNLRLWELATFRPPYLDAQQESVLTKTELSVVPLQTCFHDLLHLSKWLFSPSSGMGHPWHLFPRFTSEPSVNLMFLPFPQIRMLQFLTPLPSAPWSKALSSVIWFITVASSLRSLLLSYPLAVCFCPRSRAGLPKCKSGHVTPLLKTLRKLSCALNSSSTSASFTACLLPLSDLSSSFSSLYPNHPASMLVLGHRRHSPTSWILHRSSATQHTFPQRVTWPLPSPPSGICSNIISSERPSLTNLHPRTSHPPFHHHPHHQLAHHIFPYLTSLSFSWPPQYKDRTFIFSLPLSLGTPIHNT